MYKITIPEFGGPDVLQYTQAPTPVPGPTDVVVRSHAIGVGWPDVYVRTGTYPWQHLFPLPATPGIEMSGTVAAVGAEVREFRIGQPVYVSSRLLGFRGGCYAEQMKLPAASLVALPEGISLDAAAGLAYYQLAVALLQECARGQPVEWVLVSGAGGGVGTALVQVAKACGYRVIATVGSDDKRAHALAMGADAVFNYRSDDLRASIAQATDGHGIDLWLESYAGPGLADALAPMARWGKLVLYNAVGGHPPASFFDTWRSHISKSLSLQYFSMHVYEDDHVALRALLDRAIALIVSGRVQPPPGTYFALADAAQAHRRLESGTHRGRIFLRP